MSRKDAKEIWKLVIVSVASFSLLGASVHLIIPKELISQVIPEKTVSPVLQTDSLKIGILTSSKNYQTLIEYLQEQLGNQLEITLEGDGNLSYQAAKNKIIQNQWDIVFTLSPMLSVAAKDNGYSFAARMFPDFEPYYESALFVRNDSFIQSLADLKPTTTIALGDFNSASSFYMPVYDLYGKTLRVKAGNRSSQIREMVKTGKVDVGASSFDLVKDNPAFRVIHVSRKIPGSGVYLSPKLSNSDQTTLKKVLLDAPAIIKQQANYDVGQEPDYTMFVGISRRAEEVLSCADFSQNPINFFCPSSNPQNLTAFNDTTITGKVNGFSYVDNDTLHLKLSGKDGNLYRVVVARKILNQVKNAPPPPGLINKTLQVIGVQPVEVNSRLELKVEQANQLQVL
ncbi:phosphate/phosphite/phosphonate ABC transporter substrate-binding protein [Capilliphycus salinus ALCB114379]|uniref:phosphate/phosphite/phosphonate ABC transporter substrate-binding protein n=1 Tax=Capilliphycus salinus TaxID=2768948 RepID=UPI0039A4249F